LGKEKNYTISEINKITINLLIKKLSTMNKINDDPYINVYPSLVEYVSRQKKDIHSLISISHMVYGWMPTIIKFRLNNNDFDPWKNIKAGSLKKEFIIQMKDCINNSIVGTSKFLHFTNPDKYAIWDSRVYRSITKKRVNYNQINNVEIFIAYTKKLRELAAFAEIEKLKKDLIKKGYCNSKVSNLRVIELIFFYTPPPE
jgi:hypothetical protein